jgi:hypothetical protein
MNYAQIGFAAIVLMLLSPYTVNICRTIHREWQLLDLDGKETLIICGVIVFILFLWGVSE